MLACSLVVGCREIHHAVERVLAAPKLADNPQCWAEVTHIRSTLLDLASQLQGAFPYAELQRSLVVSAIDTDPVFTILRCRYDETVSIEAIRDSLSAAGHDPDSVLKSERLRTVGETVTVPLGVDPDYRNWQVVVGFTLARATEASNQVNRIVSRLIADGLADDAAIVARWRSVDEWLVALTDLLSRAIARSDLYTHFTTTNDESLDSLLDWTTNSLQHQ
ncbi:hypothetical protein [Haloarcula sp. H-GB5]